MCGIIGLLLANKNGHVNQLLFDGLTVLQHRGQDAAGIVTSDDEGRLHLRKDNGLVKDVFHNHHMVDLRGRYGIAHCRYPTAGSSSCAEAQPLYTNYPYGICVAHNGNLTNTEELDIQLRDVIGRHNNTDSDSEVLLNLFAEYLTQEKGNGNLSEAIFTAITKVMKEVRGGYAGLFLVNGIGLIGFRDPNGIRPLVFGCRATEGSDAKVDVTELRKATKIDGCNLDFCLSSESVAIDTLGFERIRDIRAGEAVFVDLQGNCESRICNPSKFAPCIFEYVYFARPDSIIDDVSVYETRLKMGEKLARKILRVHPDHDIDVVIPIPDTSRTSGLQVAYELNRPFREGFIKNRYIARTFIMPGQATRKKSVRLKLNTIKSEFAGKNVLLVDDSIVRGTTANEIVQMARDAGARKVYFCSAAPAIRYPNIYGIDIPTRTELVAFERNEDEVAEKIGCEWVVYQDLPDLEDSIRECATETNFDSFDSSCFSGKYITGEKIGDSYFERLYDRRNEAAKEERSNRDAHLHSSRHLSKTPLQSNGGCEPVSNDTRAALRKDDSCEGLSSNHVGAL